MNSSLKGLRVRINALSKRKELRIFPGNQARFLDPPAHGPVFLSELPKLTAETVLFPEVIRKKKLAR
jgi:hypothetical protein